MVCNLHPNQLRYLSQEEIFCPICVNKFPLPENDIKLYQLNLKKSIEDLEKQIQAELIILDPTKVMVWALYEREHLVNNILSEPDD